MSRKDIVDTIHEIAKECGYRVIIDQVMDGMSLSALSKLEQQTARLSPTYQNLRLAIDALACYGVLPMEAAEVAEIAKARVGMDPIGNYLSECFRVWHERKDKRQGEVNRGDKAD